LDYGSFNARCASDEMMNPYEVLQVQPEATQSMIKDAYRKAVKKYHPDISGSSNHETIALINEAYDILSDPKRKAAYDLRLVLPVDVEEEDPREVFKREYLRKKREEAVADEEAKKKGFQRMRRIAHVLAAVALLMVVDELLPTLHRTERFVDEWTLKRTVKRRSYYILYMRTENTIFSVPGNTALPYNLTPNQSIDIEYSPLFRIPTQVRVPQADAIVTFEPSRTMYSFAIPFHYVILAASVLVISLRHYSPFAYSLTYAPPLLTLLALMFWFLF
jgi:hypothetical protein